MPENLEKEWRQLVGQARSLLAGLALAGVRQLPSATAGLPPAAVEPTGETLAAIRADLGDCQRCRLCEQRQQIVFGAGSERARLVLVGEAPGREEDRQGEPFVGEAGKLLERILLAMELRREEVYICNVIKCRPPKNRDPRPDEIDTCQPFLIRQLQAIRPGVIVTLGKFAAQTLLRSEAPISRLRGKWQDFQGIPLLPTFHPAYLLRNPEAKREVWEDMKQVLQQLRTGAM